MGNKLYNSLLLFTVKHAVVRQDEIKMESSLANDFGLSGDDAIEFIVAFGKTFSVDVSDFMAADYFRPEETLLGLQCLGFLSAKRRKGEKVLQSVI